MLEAARVYFFVFGILTVAGGIMGYVKAGSVVSIVAGLITGVLLMAAAYLLPQYREVGLGIAFFTSLLLALQFIPRVLRTRRLVPGGIMTLLSIAGIVLAVVTWFEK
jgi:uncharacterized membrane protein (UPF0136 family)